MLYTLINTSSPATRHLTSSRCSTLSCNSNSTSTGGGAPISSSTSRTGGSSGRLVASSALVLRSCSRSFGRDNSSRALVVARADGRDDVDGNAAAGGFAQGGGDDSLVQVSVERVQSMKNAASVLYLSIKDGSGSLMPVYVGEAESVALEMELSNKRNTPRPIMYDLFKSFIQTAKYQLSHVVINDLKAKTYHATCYFQMQSHQDDSPDGEKGADLSDANSGAGGVPMVIELDSRPSDALNLAVRFNRPVYVTRKVLEKAKAFIIPAETLLSLGEEEERDGRREGAELPKIMSRTSALSKEAAQQIEASVRKLLAGYVNSNMVELQARLQVAINEERFEDAAKIRDSIESMLSKDRLNAVCVAMESAVDGKRYEEAAVLRNTFLFLKENKEREMEKNKQE
eukprot:CAMPEP_0197473672 /NCGR_PEP_ID=MMETSP1309-20131121/5070_1 /TAXON_ID=464262 /ORGANISM="Genus nov. species nov., Strain RCC998" /LENGTH=399 /DNA_ID=CAMNT_0043012923 /DNA_START=310 /DNA_END=1509 /DNA_ORIENTATION=+